MVPRILVLDNGRSYQGSHPTLLPENNLGVATSWNILWDHQCDILINSDIRVGKRTIEMMAQSDSLITMAYEYGLFRVTPELKVRVGRFDERFWPCYWEDIDYRLRVARAGVEVGSVIDPEIEHLAGGSKCYRESPWMAPFWVANEGKTYRKWGIDSSNKGIFPGKEVPDEMHPIVEHIHHCSHLPLIPDYQATLLRWLGVKPKIEYQCKTGK